MAPTILVVQVLTPTAGFFTNATTIHVPKRAVWSGDNPHAIEVAVLSCERIHIDIRILLRLGVISAAIVTFGRIIPTTEVIDNSEEVVSMLVINTQIVNLVAQEATVNNVVVFV